MADGCLVFFRSGGCDLDTAAKALAKCGLTISRRGDELTAGRPGSPRFRIVLSAAPHVAEEAADIGAGTPHEAAMRECAVRFEVGIDDLDAALDEINTLMEVQGALQDASQGFLFVPWNGNLTGPWRESSRGS